MFYVEPKDVAHIIRATFPDYRGKKVAVKACEEVTLYDLNWSGGTRNRYVGCTLNAERTGDASQGNMAPPWFNPFEGASIRIPQGAVLVQHKVFCGKDLGLTIYVHPADMPRYLPSSSVTLSDEEKAVLWIIRHLISSYRREEAEREGISPAQYDAIVESLKAKGLLNARGALTLGGKNAASSL